jgi:ribosome biogenesis SPOUT family RNA methylase Rps3
MQLRFENNQYYTPTYNSGEWLTESELQYHTSWDWLMPVVQKCFKDAHEDDFFEISGSLPDMDATHKAVVEFIEGLSVKSVEPDTKAVDEAFFTGFCHALEYVKREIENVDEVEIDVEQDSGNLTISGTINIDLGKYLDADNLIDDIMRKYERDTPKDGSNV